MMKKRNIDDSKRSESSLSNVDDVAKESPSEWPEKGLMNQKTSTTQEEETIPVWKLMLERNKRLKELMMKKRNIDDSKRSESSLTIVDHVAKESPSEWLERGLAEKISMSKQ